MTDEALLTTDEAAAYLKLKPRTVSNKAQREEIPARKIGGEWRFHPDDLRKYNEQQGTDQQQQSEA